MLRGHGRFLTQIMNNIACLLHRPWNGEENASSVHGHCWNPNTGVQGLWNCRSTRSLDTALKRSTKRSSLCSLSQLSSKCIEWFISLSAVTLKASLPAKFSRTMEGLFTDFSYGKNPLVDPNCLQSTYEGTSRGNQIWIVWMQLYCLDYD